MYRAATRMTLAFVALLCAALACAQEDGEVERFAVPLDRIATDLSMSEGRRVADACPKSMAMYPYQSPYDWPEARATLRLDRTAASTVVSIHLMDVRPRTRFSAWILPAGSGSDAVATGGLPLSTRHLAADPSGHATQVGGARGKAGVAAIDNDVWSDAHGDATFATHLGFPLGEASAEDGAGALLTFGIASHCADRPGPATGFGLRQPWFHGHVDPGASATE